MLIDFLSQDNYNQYNIRLAHLIGLEPAIYVNELLKINYKAVRKNKYRSVASSDYAEFGQSNIYFQVDRKYIEEQTTLSPSSQLTIDKKLIEMKIIKKLANTPDELCIDVEVLISWFAEQNEKVVKTLTTTLNSSTVAKQNKTEAIKEQIKIALKSNDTEIYNAYRGWVDAMFSNPKVGMLTAAAAKAFKSNIENFVNGNRVAELEIIEIAIMGSYKIPDWAITQYKTRHKIQDSCTKLVAVTSTTTMTSTDIFDF